MKPVRAGAYRHLITIQTPQTSLNADNENLQTWVDVATVKCSIETLSGRRLAVAQAYSLTANATHLIRMRWRPDIDMKCRLRFGGSVLDFDTLTDAEFEGLNDQQFETLTDEIVPDPRYFTINLINDVEERRRELLITATEDSRNG